MDERITAVSKTLALLADETGNLTAFERLYHGYLACATLAKDYPLDKLIVAQTTHPVSSCSLLADAGIDAAQVNSVSTTIYSPGFPDLQVHAFLTDDVTFDELREDLRERGVGMMIYREGTGVNVFAHIVAEVALDRFDTLLDIAELILGSTAEQRKLLIQQTTNDLLRNVPE